MPVTLQIDAGDGITSVRVSAEVVLPDSGKSLALAGTVRAPGRPQRAITGSPLTIPDNPGAGSLFWQVSVDWMTGAATLLQSTTADPAPAERGPKMAPLLASGLMPALDPPRGSPAAVPADASTSVVILRQTLTSSSPAAAWQNTTTRTL